MMTVISSICGMMPLAFGEGSGTELYRGMGTALIGGLGFSAMFTLFLVPVLMSLMMDLGFHTRQEDLVKASLMEPSASPRIPVGQNESAPAAAVQDNLIDEFRMNPP